MAYEAHWLLDLLERGNPIPPGTEEWRVEKARETLAEHWLGPREDLWSKEKKRRRRVKTAQMIDACSKYLGEDPLELPPRWDRLPVLEGISLMRVALRRAGLLQEA